MKFKLGLPFIRPGRIHRTRRLAALSLAAGVFVFCGTSRGNSADKAYVYHPLDLNSPAIVAKIDKQADAILKRLTLGQKIKMLANPNGSGLFTVGFKDAGVPALKTSDASVGIVEFGPSTAYPASEALAASWDLKLAYREGRSIGRDSRARGINLIFGPGVDIVREPQCGRNFEYLGEDPYLAGHIGAAWIRGLQSMRVAACVKHYAVNEQETHRHTISEDVGMRALREIYLPPFRDAIKLGNVMEIMAALNKVNGQYCTANRFLLTTILRNTWGFRGVVRSDGGATHGTLGPLTAGLDFENPNPKYYNAGEIMPLLKSGQITEATIDTHVRRLLRLIIAMNFEHGKQKDPAIPLDDPHSRAIALRVAAEGTVLLKNAGGILPLHRRKIKTIVVVGPNATPAVTGGGGSSHVTPIHHPVSMLAAIRAAAGPNVQVEYLPYPVRRDCYADSHYLPVHGVEGLEGTYFQGTNYFTGQPVAVGFAKQINFNWQLQAPVPQIKGGSAFSVRWEGRIRPRQTGLYQFSMACDDGARVYLNGKQIIDNWGPHPLFRKDASVRLTAGKTYDLRIEYYNLGGIAQVFFGWKNQATGPISRSQAATIRSADAVIACVGTHDSEGSDHSFKLPNHQDEYLHQVGLLNRHTIVVVNSGDNVAMSHWIHSVAGLIYAWFPGENGNTAVARIIFGDINPGGRLPETFGRHWKDSPAYGHFPGHDGQVNLAEGIFVGYRWFDKKHIKPRFPFGFGLSYTQFSLGHLTLSTHGNGKNRLITASVTVTNIGKRSGAEVVQLYVHPPQNGSVDRCVQKLEGFKRVNLEPGQSKTVFMKLHWRDFAYFDTQANQWEVPSGTYEIAVGKSSRDESLKKAVTW